MASSAANLNTLIKVDEAPVSTCYPVGTLSLSFPFQCAKSIPLRLSLILWLSSFIYLFFNRIYAFLRFLQVSVDLCKETGNEGRREDRHEKRWILTLFLGAREEHTMVCALSD